MQPRPYLMLFGCATLVACDRVCGEAYDAWYSDLTLSEMSLPEVSCDPSGEVCTTVLSFQVDNSGAAPAESFAARVLFDPDQAIEVVWTNQEPLAAGGAQTVSVEAPPGPSCLDPDCTVCAELFATPPTVERSLENNFLCSVRPALRAVPDLVVTRVDPPSVRCTGDASESCSTLVTFRVENPGEADVPPFEYSVTFNHDQSLVVSDTAPGIDAGGSITLSASSPPGPSCFDPSCEVCVELDASDAVLETSEANNGRCVESLGPDLVVGALTAPVSVCLESGVCSSGTTVTVRNVGPGAAGPFATRLRFDPDQVEEVVLEHAAGLAPGETVVLQASTAGSAAGDCFDPDCSVCAVVDVNSQVEESNEGNNELCRTDAPPPPPPDLQVSSIDEIDSACVGALCTTTFLATIVNVGAGPAAPFAISATATSQQVDTRVEVPAGLEAGGQIRLSVELPPTGSGCFIPDCTVCATADPQNAVPETDEADNQLCVTILG